MSDLFARFLRHSIGLYFQQSPFEHQDRPNYAFLHNFPAYSDGQLADLQRTDEYGFERRHQQEAKKWFSLPFGTRTPGQAGKRIRQQVGREDRNITR